MRFLRLAVEGLAVLSRSRMRALFMMLGTVLGIGSLTVVMSMNDGAKAELEEHLNRFGADNIRVHAGGGRMRGAGRRSTTLTMEDGDAIKAGIPGLKSVNPMLFIPDADVQHEGETTRVVVIGASAHGLEAAINAVGAGRRFTASEVDQLARVCLVGPETAKVLFKGASPLGGKLLINRVQFTVVGVLAPQGAMPQGPNIDERVVMPVTTAARRVFRVDHVSALEIASADRERIDEQAEQVRQLLRTRHHITEGKEDDFHVMTASAMSSFRMEMVNKSSLLFGLLAVLCLLVGGGVMMNILLVSVGERTREIGLRRAVGASQGDVFVQFLAESMAVNLLGMVLGVALGFGAALLVERFAEHMPMAFSWRGVALSMLFSLVVAVTFGTLPARRAARLSPVEALR